MGSYQALIERAFEKLQSQPGFIERQNQKQLALLIADCMDGCATGLFEAPTGLGKSLSALIPALAHAISSGKRTIVSTYTNVLAEQYLRKDLPIARGLFDEDVSCQFLIGRQRYACLAELETQDPPAAREFVASANLGIESEFRRLKRSAKELDSLWKKVAAPPICHGRACSLYSSCYYYKARRALEKAKLVITNHSVVLQDALLKQTTEAELSLLGQFDFLIIDEAHDLISSASSALEFEISDSKVRLVSSMVGSIEQEIAPIAVRLGGRQKWRDVCERYRKETEQVQLALSSFGSGPSHSKILSCSPITLLDDEIVKRLTSEEAGEAERIVDRLRAAIMNFTSEVERNFARWLEERLLTADEVSSAMDSIKNYLAFISEYAEGCRRLFCPEGVSVSHCSGSPGGGVIRHDVVGLAEPLSRMIWDETPCVLMSATLAVDGEFEFFKRLTGVAPQFEEVLPSPYDFRTQSALYVPGPGLIPDPTIARQEGFEPSYFDAIAHQLERIITICEGRTLALFHSRREMEAVYQRISLPEDLPLFIQKKSGSASIGDRFRRERKSSLFALRSFWTGFDAPGDTLSCVVLVRIPFEVPIDPPQIVRSAHLASQEVDPFSGHMLPLAKMMMRQGAGRLIRSSTDKGLIALLDPRLTSKRYGEEIIANMPLGIRQFSDLEDAVGWLGLIEDDASV